MCIYKVSKLLADAQILRQHESIIVEEIKEVSRFRLNVFQKSRGILYNNYAWIENPYNYVYMYGLSLLILFCHLDCIFSGSEPG